MSAEWTFLVYMSADNDLEDAANETLDEIAAATHNAAITVAVEVDWFADRMQRFVFRDGQRQVHHDGRRVNTGDPAVLTDFIDWAQGTYPSRFSALSVWDHGGGWEDPEVNPRAFSRPRPSDEGRGAHKIATNYHSADYLTDQELREAIEQTRSGGVDVLGCDACYMGMVELAYEMRGTTSFYVASEAKQPRPWCYRDILSRLAKTPTMSPRALASTIVSVFEDTYRGRTDLGLLTLSALEIANLESLCDAIDGFARALLPHVLTDVDNLLRVRKKTIKLGVNVDYADVGSLVQSACAVLDDDVVREAGAGVSTALDRALAAKADLQPESSGTTIFFPNDNDLLFGYGALAYAQAHQWGGFLRALFAPQP